MRFLTERGALAERKERKTQSLLRRTGELFEQIDRLQEALWSPSRVALDFDGFGRTIGDPKPRERLLKDYQQSWKKLNRQTRRIILALGGNIWTESTIDSQDRSIVNGLESFSLPRVTNGSPLFRSYDIIRTMTPQTQRSSSPQIDTSNDAPTMPSVVLHPISEENWETFPAEPTLTFHPTQLYEATDKTLLSLRTRARRVHDFFFPPLPEHPSSHPSFPPQPQRLRITLESVLPLRQRRPVLV